MDHSKKITKHQYGTDNQAEAKLVKLLLYKPAPLISAASWVVLDRKTKEVLFGRLEKDRREVASLTKIMTLYTCLSLADSLQIDLQTLVVVNTSCADVLGTSAFLRPGDHLKLEDLLYGLMLPSGNDAAHMLAMWFGRKVI